VFCCHFSPQLWGFHYLLFANLTLVWVLVAELWVSWALLVGKYHCVLVSPASFIVVFLLLVVNIFAVTWTSLDRIWSLSLVLWMGQSTSVESMPGHCGNTSFGSTWDSCRLTSNKMIAQVWKTQSVSISTGMCGSALPHRTHRYTRRWVLAHTLIVV
jgi:hypothetical protein